MELPVFEGPLDLLLYLVRKHEIDVFDIPIAVIIGKYLEYLDAMKDLDIDLASEFLVMAATLLQIKSRMVLPMPPAGEDEEALEGGPDPREELVRRLLEYCMYKDAAQQLTDFTTLGWDVFTRGYREKVETAAEEEIPFSEVDAFALVSALSAVLAASADKTTVEITPESISVREKMLHILSVLTGRDTMQFSALLSGGAGRAEMIALFLAVLELTKLGMTRLGQSGDLCEIYVWKSFEDLDQAKGTVEDIWQHEA